VVLMLENEPSERVLVLTAGRVKVSRTNDDGHEVILSIRDPGDVLGELSAVDLQPRIATVAALEAATAAVIPAGAFRAHLERTPRVAVALLEVVTQRFRETTVKRAQFATSDTIGRLAARLVELAERYGEPSTDGIELVSPLSLEEIAAWTGASRAGVAAGMHTLRELGWIQTQRRLIVVRDLDALRNRAG
jgi:CRP/FNR family transcriptional regulator, cyclic AMP receptor protein